MKNLEPRTLLIGFLFTVCISFNGLSQNNIEDLMGAKATIVDGFMNNKGYVHIHSARSYGGTHSYWWKASKNKCVSINIEDGRVLNTKTTTASDCNQGGNNYSYQNHQAHNHDSYNHYDNSSHESSFERGYNDGLYNKSYHNTTSDSQSRDTYVKGYEAGVTQRASNTNYHSGGGGYTSNPKLGDLKGWAAQRAYKEIENRGFQHIKDYTNNGKLVKVWYNSKYRKCKKTAEKSGHIDLVEDSKQCGK